MKKEKSVFDYLMDHDIDEFTYRGRLYVTLDLITERDPFLDMPVEGYLAPHYDRIEEAA